MSVLDKIKSLFNDHSLEREFEEYKAEHKYAILKARIMAYYKYLHESTLNVPYFMPNISHEIERKANRDLSRAMRDGSFNYLYERAWEEVKEYLD